MERKYFREPQKVQVPQITIYNGPAEKLHASMRLYFQFPVYKELNIGYGSSLKCEGFYTITPQKIGLDSYLMIQMDGEQEARAINISKVPVLPLTIQIQNRGRVAFLTIEQVKDTAIQLRTFNSKE